MTCGNGNAPGDESEEVAVQEVMGEEITAAGGGEQVAG